MNTDLVRKCDVFLQLSLLGMAVPEKAYKVIEEMTPAVPRDTKQTENVFAIGDHVKKIGGDYAFYGIVVSAFKKRSGQARYVVENNEGILHVYSGKNLVHDKLDQV